MKATLHLQQSLGQTSDVQAEQRGVRTPFAMVIRVRNSVSSFLQCVQEGLVSTHD